MVTACRALDRVIRAGRYWVPHWYKASHWIAYWDVFGRPPEKPRYARGVPETWWYDRDKAAKLERPGLEYASTAERKLGTHFSLAGERFCFHGPAEGLGHGLVEIGDELLDLGAQRFLAGEIAATEELSRQDREPDLDLIEP